MLTTPALSSIHPHPEDSTHVRSPVPGCPHFVSPDGAVGTPVSGEAGALLLWGWECSAKKQIPEDVAQGYQEQKRKISSIQQNCV